MTSFAHSRAVLTYRQILHIWWPLAGSWLVMTSELPLISAVIARLPAPEINLAAWGVVFSIAILIQAPSAMILAASTALCKDWDSYRKLRRFMYIFAAGLTGLHILIAFTPVYYLLIEKIMAVPPAIVEPTRYGLMIMTPWTFGTAYRRFQHGVLIRFDHSRIVIWGAFIRLGADIVILGVGYLVGGIPGIIIGSSAIIIAVLCEALYAGLMVRPVLRHQLKSAPHLSPELTLRMFLNFYIPLAMTVLLMLLVQPLVSAALSRMPYPLESLAMWPVVFGLLTIWQSVGLSYNEAVIALLDEQQAVPVLRRFTLVLVLVTVSLLFVMAATPLSAFWFSRIAGLNAVLVVLAQQALWLGLPLPATRILQSWFQGALTYSRQTQGITEAVVIFLVVSSVLLWAGTTWNKMAGIYVGLSATVAASVMQTLWLWFRAKPTLQSVLARDEMKPPLSTT
jgi:hypothetical protein